MSAVARPAIRDLIGQLARIEDILRVTPTHVTGRRSSEPSPVMAALLITEQDIIKELRRPGRPGHLPAGRPGYLPGLADGP
ncbi:hypothetical protein V3G39_09435 [Dermatophilaceae bacterium Sec6.4]